jgi:uncharacterized membrane protein
MVHRPINKKLAITFLIFCNFLCLWAFWIGFNEILASLQSHADVIRVGSRAGFFVVVIAFPILCLVPIVEKFWPDFLKKHSKLMSQCIVIGIIALLAAGVIGSSWIKARVENAGYTYCRNASGISALARTLVYTKNMDICEELVEAEIKSRRR